MKTKNDHAIDYLVSLNSTENDEYTSDQIVSAFIAGTELSVLTKREHFAALALQGILACPRDMFTNYYASAQSAVEFADELIAELKK